MKHVLVIIVAIMVLAGPGSSRATIPNVWGEWSWDHTAQVHLLATPAGTGPALTQAEVIGGGTVDATIRIQLWYEAGSIEDPQPPAPLAHFPAEDLWLEASGLSPCMGGVSADGATDAEGWFTFSRPLLAGGWIDPGDTPPLLFVVASGNYLWDQDGNYIAPSILINSPDLNADRRVNLSDVALFAGDFHGDYSFRSDFLWDGVLNLSDIVRLASHMGDECP